VAVRCEVVPGVVAQVGFGAFALGGERGRRRGVLACVMLLSHSCSLQVEFVQQWILYDHVMTLVLERLGERVVFHPRLLDLALLVGFALKACLPYRAQCMGLVVRAHLLPLKPSALSRRCTWRSGW
jgi:hypothetical protein